MKLKDILIILLIAVIGYFLLFGGSSTHTSSLIIDEVHDTTFVYDTVEVKELVLDTFYVTEKDTFVERGVYPVNKYQFKINDSLLNGTIFVTSPFKPTVSLEYNVKSFNIKDSITIQPSKDFSGYFYGGSLVVKPFGTELYLDAAKSFKNGNMINVSIGRNLELKQTVYKIGFLKKF